MAEQETRQLLDPLRDPIPTGPYPKLRNCKLYPLRQDCNHGETKGARWTRCEHMKYDRNQPGGFARPGTWVCTAKD